MIDQAHQGANDVVMQVLRLCLRGRRDPAALQAARTLVAHADLDWNHLYEVADQERVAPLLYDVVGGQDMVPPALEQELHKAYGHTAARNALLLDALGEVLRRLASEGVSVIVLKGAALAEVVYGDIALRPMRDLDLLVRPEDLPAARQLMVALGYASPGAAIGPGRPRADDHAEALLKQGIIDIPVELHWRLVGSRPQQQVVSTDWVWETALPARIGDAPARMLGPEAQVFHLCAHLLLHHGGRGLLWLHDVAEVITFYRARIDWGQVLARAETYNLVLSVQQILSQVADEWRAPIPTAVVARLRALHPARFEGSST